MIKRDDKRGQITIFVIVAIIIVALIGLLFVFRQQIPIFQTQLSFSQQIEKCGRDNVQEAIKILATQGGKINPENYKLYQGNKIEYICYTNEYWKPCLNQQPLLKQHLESEIENYARPKVESCINSVKTDLESKGYTVEVGKSDIDVSIEPDIIRINIPTVMNVVKESAQRYDGFKTTISSKLYDLLMISTTIVNYEARYGDSDQVTLMLYYPSIIIDKKKFEDGKVYTLKNDITGDSFAFATRSYMYPEGYGFSIVRV